MRTVRVGRSVGGKESPRRSEATGNRRMKWEEGRMKREQAKRMPEDGTQ